MVDGKSLLRDLRELLNESSTSSWVDDRTSYGYLYKAAVEFIRRTQSARNEQSITTVAEQAGYTLNANFLEMYLKNERGKLFIKYNDGTSNHFIEFKDYEDIIYENQTTSVTVPDHFSIIDDSTKDTRVTGTATLAGAASGGECTLTDTAADFSDVSPGDIVHNTTDSSDGVVLSKTSSTALVTALFNGTNNAWTLSDSYVIQPQARQKLILSPPSSTANHTITVFHIEKPAPVFSAYGIYRIPTDYLQALVFYAMYLYKYRDAKPNVGDRFNTFFEGEISKASYSLNRTYNRRGFDVAWKK